jgi:predicted negative regulator of RcsB-dependent stress response
MLTYREKEEKEKFIDKLNSVIVSTRTYLLAILVVFILVVAAYFIYSEINKKTREESTERVEKAQELYSEWFSEQDEAAKSKIKDDLLGTLDRIVKEYPRHYAAQRALFIKANVYFEEEEWEEAAEEFLRIPEKFSDSYLSSESLIRAAICYEELDNTDKALKQYLHLTDKFLNSPRIPQALFAQGRLHELNDNVEEAIRVYSILKLDYSYSNWTKLAVSRIIDLRSRGEIGE